jgi:hypothetical protein
MKYWGRVVVAAQREKDSAMQVGIVCCALLRYGNEREGEKTMMERSGPIDDWLFLISFSLLQGIYTNQRFLLASSLGFSFFLSAGLCSIILYGYWIYLDSLDVVVVCVLSTAGHLNVPPRTQ